MNNWILWNLQVTDDQKYHLRIEPDTDVGDRILIESNRFQVPGFYDI